MATPGPGPEAIAGLGGVAEPRWSPNGTRLAWVEAVGGRVDLRLMDTGEIYVIEVNASCYLEQTSEFATAAAAAGIDFPSLVDRIIELAAERGKLHASRARA